MPNGQYEEMLTVDGDPFHYIHILGQHDNCFKVAFDQRTVDERAAEVERFAVLPVDRGQRRLRESALPAIVGGGTRRWGTSGSAGSSRTSCKGEQKGQGDIPGKTYPKRDISQVES